MYSASSRVRNIELPENLFSNLGEQKSKIPHQKDSTLLKEYKKDNTSKLTNYEKKYEYRNRISKMYEGIKDLTPIDSEIDSTLYFDNYTERGIVIKPKIASLKQFWTEYRLISNEKTAIPSKEKKEDIHTTLNNFDTLFEALSTRVKEINKYIDELKEMRSTIDKSNLQLKEEQQKLSADKKEFLDFKKTEENKIKTEKENLKINFERLQTIIDDLDKKLGSIDPK